MAPRRGGRRPVASTGSSGRRRRVLDLGTGTGKAAPLAASLSRAEVVGVDLSSANDRGGRRRGSPPSCRDASRFEVADASASPFADGAFDLVVLLNMIPFFAQPARVTAPPTGAVSRLLVRVTPFWSPRVGAPTEACASWVEPGSPRYSFGLEGLRLAVRSANLAGRRFAQGVGRGEESNWRHHG